MIPEGEALNPSRDRPRNVKTESRNSHARVLSREITRFSAGIYREMRTFVGENVLRNGPWLPLVTHAMNEFNLQQRMSAG